MKLGLLFAGQGSQKIGMGKDLYREKPEFKEVFDLLDDNQKEIAWNGDIETLSDTENTQPIMVAFALGVYNCLKSKGIIPDMTAGLSLGEYSALGASGTFDNKTAIDLVTKRAVFMHRASEGISCEMKAVLGLDVDTVAICCREVSSIGIAEITNLNCPGQIVIGGESKAVDAAAKLAEEKGAKRTMPLSVSGPFHTKFMEPAGIKLEKELNEASINKMEFPVIFNAIGTTAESSEDIRDLLVKQISSTVLFEKSLRFMLDNDIDTFIEIGPGKVLSGFLKKVDRKIKSYQIEDTKTLDEVIKALKGAK